MSGKTLVIAAIALFTLSAASSADVTVLYDFADRYPDAKITNLMSSRVGNARAGQQSKRGLFVHPSSSGDAVAQYSVALPSTEKDERLVLAFSAGLNEGIRTDDPKHPFDGVAFSVKLNGAQEFSAELAESRWIEHAVDLTAMAGKTIKIEFITNPRENSSYDWAVWGDPKILRLSKGLISNAISGIKAGKGIVVVDYLLPPAHVTIEPESGTGKSVSWSSEDSTAKLAVIPFDFTADGVESVSLGLTASIGGAQVYEFRPQLEITGFGPSRALLFADELGDFRCAVKNIGEGVLKEAVTATLNVDGKPYVTQIGPLNPGEESNAVWKGIRLPLGITSASVNIDGGLSASWTGVTSNLPGELPSEAERAEGVKLADGTILLQGPQIRMHFVTGQDGYTGWLLSASKNGKWHPAASGLFGKVVVASNNGLPITVHLNPKQVDLSETAVTFRTTEEIEGAKCEFEWTYRLSGPGPRITARHRMTSQSSVKLLHFTGPTLYAGDGAFGADKDEGLFPGLEYLLTESSSGTEFVSPPTNLRTVPHPNKITIPIMAVRSGETLVFIEWDPRQKWDRTNDRPAAVFASPNFLEAQDNHKMGLFVPSVPAWTAENQHTAKEPYDLEAGRPIAIGADFIVMTESASVIDSIDAWISFRGFPDPSKPEMPMQQVVELIDKSFTESAWDDEARSWKHTNTGPSFFDPLIAAYIQRRLDRSAAPESIQALKDVLDQALAHAGERVNLDLALRVGGVEEALQKMEREVKGLIASQKEDGSWSFSPDEKHKALGTPGDSSSGFTAIKACVVLRYALVTGDPAAEKSGLKAIEYLDTQTRPEGAQTWELQLHVPDILASARILTAYLYAYQLTDEQAYVERAVYWAKTGLPFIYLWNAADRPVMRYGTIPVFGATWFDSQPWFGVLVQWCGLEYAYSISQLAALDSSLPWKKIAEGIMNCGIQQLEYTYSKYPAHAGMYPDAFSAVTGEEEYHWDLNPRYIIRQYMMHLGYDLGAGSFTTRDERGRRLTLTLPTQNGKLEYRKEWLRASFPGVASGITQANMYGILAGVIEPTAIGINDEMLLLFADLKNRQEGWMYMPDRVTSILKFNSIRHNQMLIDLMRHETTDYPWEKADAAPAP